MERSTYYRLHENIANPVCVNYNRKNNSLVYVTSNKTKNGPVIAAVSLNQTLYGERAHKIVSIHPRENIGIY